jgi:uncharacterized protein YqjF (DUF2071 family)
MPDSPVSDAERLRARQRPPGRALMRQVWRHLGFLHWPVAPAAIEPLLPPGLQVDTFGGVAYVGVVPFTIPLTRTALGGLPMAPAFHELNVRTYVHRDGRDPGVWFFSLDAASRLAVAGARVAYRLPYFHARMTMDVGGGGEGGEGAPTIDYRSRRASGDATFSGRYRPAGAVALAAPGSLELFLAERYVLYAWTGRALRTARVAHAAYPLQPAVADGVVQTLTDAARLPAGAFATPPQLVHYAREVDVAIFAPTAPLP